MTILFIFFTLKSFIVNKIAIKPIPLPSDLGIIPVEKTIGSNLFFSLFSVAASSNSATLMLKNKIVRNPKVSNIMALFTPLVFYILCKLKKPH